MGFYCSKRCQKADWKARHKIICKQAKERRDLVSDVSSKLTSFVDFSNDGNNNDGEGGDLIEQRMDMMQAGAGRGGSGNVNNRYDVNKPLNKSTFI